MRYRLSLAAGALLLAGHQPALGAPDASLAADAEAFGLRESAQSMSVSPSGNKVLLIAPGPKRSQLLQLVDMTSGQMSMILKADGEPESFRWCDFASDTQLVCKYGGDVRMDSDIVGFSRLVTLGADGKNIRSLGTPDNGRQVGIKQTDGDILDWLPDQPGNVLMARNYLAEVGIGTNISKGSGLGVDRIDLASGKVSRVESPREGVNDYLTDGRGNVRLMISHDDDDGVLTGVTKFRYRQQGSKDWKDFGEYRSADNSGDYPIAIEAESDSAFVLTETNGRDVLYRVALDASGARTLIAANPKVDIDTVVRLGHGQKVIGYTYADDRRHTVYFDPEYSKLAAGLAKVIPGNPVVQFVGANADAGKLLVFASSDTQPGMFYLYERATRRLNEIAAVRPQLEGRALAAVKPILIPAGGDVKIPGYLTLPVGSSGKGLPAVVLPHGGPSARDEWGFDWLAQFLAARGYAVIQPNYRGSAGYGEEWLGANGFRQWETSIADISSAARYLVAEGIADPQRLAIVGWSYGGYAALQSAAVQPDLYKAAVAIAPVTDLSMLKREAANFTNSRLVAKFVGSGDHVSSGSPLRRADAIRVPVLLVHGDMDANVGVQHSVRMADALQKNGVRTEFLRYKDLDHQLDDSSARIEMLMRIGEFLEKAIGR
ncbi:alpha/beta hydrolase family protein [Sphingomonas arenae]|uniref:alpha/beta hydrolase family protein n=1 Tax=Sphingomonas arenae TaxID=2812555 RepID=UPI0019685105|nr:S9 family peptidase [Sphingomonas arenae]